MMGYETENKFKLHFFDLDELVIDKIISFCDLLTLGRLSLTCSQMNDLVKRNLFWTNLKNKLTCVGYSSYFPRNMATFEIPSAKEFCYLSKCWTRNKKHNDHCLVFLLIKQMPYLLLDNNEFLYYSDTKSIKFLISTPKREINFKWKLGPEKYMCPVSSDIVRFCKNDDILVAGYRNGYICSFVSNSINPLINYPSINKVNCKAWTKGHTKDVNTIDIQKDVLLSGSSDETIKLWKLKESEIDESEFLLLKTSNMADRVLSLAFNNQATMFLAGTAGLGPNCPITLWTTEDFHIINKVGQEFKRGAGMLDISFHPQWNNIILAAGYDTYLRMWDLRISAQKCILSFEEPFDNAIYCFKSDGQNCLLTGSSRHSMVCLWDIRKIYKYPIKTFSSPFESSVYSLAFNPSNLFTALDSRINCFLMT